MGGLHDFCAVLLILVSGGRPAAALLRRRARLVQHTYRGQRWYVMQDLASGRVLRFNPSAYRVLALMDGVRTLDEIWRNACLNLGDEAPTQTRSSAC